ncbi:transglutaminase family protein [Methyloligella solikamskensis]|uniref:Transglutaminase domain-containing protein n=1 Tax=Methyloligella solikamskensis TaxID=1177756 RepID=A0ABW3JD66_9HYPH
MLIRVEHTTKYSYSEPVLASTQYLRMTPHSGRTQAVESWKLTVPGASTQEWTDQYGNLCHTLTVNKPITSLEIRVSGLVRTRNTDGIVGLSQSELPPGLYLRETEYTACTPSLKKYAEAFRAAVEKDPIEGLHKIMLQIADDVSYSPGETHVHTKGAEALEQGQGVCQDHAHIFCTICRCLGVPARYVSGYLGEDMEQAGQASSHAWAEALVDKLGWVSFDPTNRSSATEAHIRSAVGLDYAEASPIRGVRSGGGIETMSAHVAFPSQGQSQNQTQGQGPSQAQSQ